jgi:hypothetical protein
LTDAATDGIVVIGSECLRYQWPDGHQHAHAENEGIEEDGVSQSHPCQRLRAQSTYHYGIDEPQGDMGQLRYHDGQREYYSLSRFDSIWTGF